MLASLTQAMPLMNGMGGVGTGREGAGTKRAGSGTVKARSGIQGGGVRWSMASRVVGVRASPQGK